MKYLFFAILSLGFVCNGKHTASQNNTAIRHIATLNNKIIGKKMKIKIGTETFMATLEANETAMAFKAKLPLSLAMLELNGNEKYAQLPADLPTSTADVGTIHEGDLMLWGANTLVVFYKTFKTSYRYSKLGRIDNPRGLAAAVGSRNVTISFEME